MKPTEFFSAFAHFAVESQLETRVPASVTLAQAALESGWGERAPKSNFFGVKGVGLVAEGLRKQVREGHYREGFTPVPPDLQVLWTREWIGGRYVRVQDVFAAYPTPKEGFDAHGHVLARVKRYSGAFRSRDGLEFAVAVANAGYATDPYYARKLTGLIRKWGLMQYDDLADLA